MGSSTLSNPSSPTQRLPSLRGRLGEVERALLQSEGQVRLLREQIDRALDAAGVSKHEVLILGHVNTVLQELERNWRRSYEEGMATLISQGLSAAFGEPIRVDIQSTIVRDATSMELRLTHNGITVGDIIEGTGGSIVSILNVLLLLLLLVSVQPPLRRICVLDEPFRMCEARHLPAIGNLLRELGARLGVQFIITSHEAELLEVADVVYEVQPDGTVKQIKSTNEERQ